MPHIMNPSTGKSVSYTKTSIKEYSTISKNKRSNINSM